MIEVRSSITIRTRGILKVLVGVVIALALCHLMVLGFRSMGHGNVLGFVPEFDLDQEGNVPTYVSAMLLFLAGLVLSLIALLKVKERDAFAWRWSLLALIFFYLSMDEGASLHEQLIAPMRAVIETSGLLRFAWVIPAALLVLLFATAYWRFLWHLPRKTRTLVALAGVIYVGGALGVEMLGAWQYSNIEAVAGERRLFVQRKDVLYNLFVTLEESMEMMGTTLFIYALLDYLRRQVGSLRVHFQA